MKVITAIDEDYSLDTNNGTKIFLAGGITNCPNWQKDAIDYFKRNFHENVPITIYNPRRENFPINDPNASEQQIVWEFNHLSEADIILYWFSAGSPNPIVFYELGMHCNSHAQSFSVPCYIGCDPNFERKRDVIIQTALARPELTIYDDLFNMCDSIVRRFTNVE